MGVAMRRTVEKPKISRTEKNPCWRGVGDAAPFTAGIPENVPRARSLAALFRAMECCTRCDLARGRTQVVHGFGPSRADTMLIGEAPGGTEDRQGMPFVGRAGRLLDELLELAQLRRDDVFITNVVACRPPGNRAPKAAEIRAHTPWLEEQLRLVSPRLVVTLGRTALSYFLPGEKITEIHGKVCVVESAQEELRLMPTFHPAAALRGRVLRSLIEKDFRAIARALRRPR
jgi:uracil-DNA glycosylase